MVHDRKDSANLDKTFSLKAQKNIKMNAIRKIIFLITLSITSFKSQAQKKSAFKPKVVFQSKDLIVTQISKNAFEHTSFKQTQDFGYVPCNGMIVRNNNEAIVFDTPTNDSIAAALINWVKQVLKCKIKAIIPTHFHDDCLGGLKAFHENGIPSYANFKTLELAKANNMTVPQNGFTDSLTLQVGNEKMIAQFFGEGHTKDNIVCYFPSENVLFGGCLIKELEASKGYLGDANVAAWSSTVEKVKKAFPNVKCVVPGHGEFGNRKLLDYTIQLFRGN